MAVQVVFAIIAFAIAIWLLRRWRRMRRRGVRNGAYYFVTLNVFGSIVFGAALLWQPCEEVLANWRASRDARELARFAIRCDRTVIEIRNNGDSPRHVTVGDVALQSASMRLLDEPQSFYADVQPRARDRD